MKQNMAFKVIADLNLFVVVFGAGEPTNQEWLDYLRWVERAGVANDAQLVVTDGGAPDYFQRRFLADMMGGEVVRVAVVSDNEPIAALVRQMSAINSGIKLFPPAHFRDALDHLKIDKSHSSFIEDIVLILRVSLGIA